MVAYSFKPRFPGLIIARTKGGTVRDERKPPSRHARPGEALQLYQSQRTRHCKLISRETCLDAQSITLNFTTGRVCVAALAFATAQQLDVFAVFDGFDDWADMRRFWYDTHPYTSIYSGAHIRWLDWPKELRA